MDQLGAITLFNKVVETGSFSEAARQSNLSTSSVSRRVVELEAWVGAALLHRTTRRLRLTEVGRVFHLRTKDILLDLEDARITAGRLEDQPAGLMRITMPASLEQHIVVAASLFQARWPSVRFTLVSSDRNIDLITEGFDLAIRAGELRDSTLRVKKIVDVKRRLCASPQYLATAPELAHPMDIENHDCLLLSRTQTYKNWRFSDGDSVHDVRASGKFIANSGNMLINAARHGRGLILSPDWLMAPYIANGELIELLSAFKPFPENSTLYAVHPYQRFVPPHLRLFIDFLTDRFSDKYDWTRQPTKLPLPDFT